MIRFSIRAIPAVFLGVLFMANAAEAQLIRAPLDSGFARTSSIAMSVDEMLGPQKKRTPDEPLMGPGYPDLWIAEVQIKPLRYRRMSVTDPKTGTSNTELVWYMVYRVIPRDFTDLAGGSRDELIAKLGDTVLTPQNTIDNPTRYSLQIPRFVLRTEDSADFKEYTDEVNLEIQREVLVREFTRSSHLRMLNSIQAITEVVEAASADDPDPLAKALYGVAVWRNVDPETDFLTVTMTGFSNAYRIIQQGGESVFEHKIIEQKFVRPGDRYNQQEAEFRIIDKARMTANGDVVLYTDSSVSTYKVGQPAPAMIGDLRLKLDALRAAEQPTELSWPTWKYQARPASISVPNFDRILRNAGAPDAGVVQ